MNEPVRPLESQQGPAQASAPQPNPNSLAVRKPIVLDSDGVLSQLPNGALINAGGTISPTFTVGGRGLLFDDGSSTSGGAISQSTLQSAYNNTQAVDGKAQINLVSGKDFAIVGSSSGSTYLNVDAETGDIVLSSTVDVGGNAIFRQNISVEGTINGINIQTLNAAFNAHTAGTQLKHPAAAVTVAPIPGFLSIAADVQTALELINTELSKPTTAGYEHEQQEPDVTWVVNHSLGTRRVHIAIYDDNWEQIIPDSVRLSDINTITVSFSSPVTGRAMVISF